MKQKSLVLILGVVALSAIMIISAATVFTMTMPMTANVSENDGAVSVTIDSTNYANGATLNIDWGNVAPGSTYTKQIIIDNDYNRAVTPSISTTGTLPAGSSITLSNTDAIPAFGSVTCNIVFTVGSSAVMDSYSWSATLNVATS